MQYNGLYYTLVALDGGKTDLVVALNNQVTM